MKIFALTEMSGFKIKRTFFHNVNSSQAVSCIIRKCNANVIVLNAKLSLSYSYLYSHSCSKLDWCQSRVNV